MIMMKMVTTTTTIMIIYLQAIMLDTHIHISTCVSIQAKYVEKMLFFSLKSYTSHVVY